MTINLFFTIQLTWVLFGGLVFTWVKPPLTRFERSVAVSLMAIMMGVNYLIMSGGATPAK